MDRPSPRNKITFFLLLSLLFVIVSSGCMSGLASMMYFIKGTNLPPEYKYLKGKTVAVLVRPVVDLQYCHSNVPLELAQELTIVLKKNVPKIKMIDPQKVSTWCDENDAQDVVAMGKALKADMVVSVELGGFALYQGQTIYQGRAVANIQVFDCRDAEKKAKDKDRPKEEIDSSNNIVFEKSPPEYKYPPTTGIPASERQEPDFRQEFVKRLADYIGRHFYEHDSHADFAVDSETLSR